MASSKVWRKGRWFWSCREQNRASDWKDYWACRAVSRLTYSSQKEAEQAGQGHTRRRGHQVVAAQIPGKAGRKRKVRRNAL